MDSDIGFAADLLRDRQPHAFHGTLGEADMREASAAQLRQDIHSAGEHETMMIAEHDERALAEDILFAKVAAAQARQSSHAYEDSASETGSDTALRSRSQEILRRIQLAREKQKAAGAGVEGIGSALQGPKGGSYRSPSPSERSASFPLCCLLYTPFG